jgi:hypothetical protein
MRFRESARIHKLTFIRGRKGLAKLGRQIFRIGNESI